MIETKEKEIAKKRIENILKYKQKKTYYNIEKKKLGKILMIASAIIMFMFVTIIFYLKLGLFITMAFDGMVILAICFTIGLYFSYDHF